MELLNWDKGGIKVRMTANMFIILSQLGLVSVLPLDTP